MLTAIIATLIYAKPDTHNGWLIVSMFLDFYAILAIADVWRGR